MKNTDFVWFEEFASKYKTVTHDHTEFIKAFAANSVGVAQTERGMAYGIDRVA